MFRLLSLMVALALVLGVGAVHGTWTDRWGRSEVLEAAAERLAALPDDLDDWKGVAYEQEPEALALAGAVTHYSRTFTDPVTGDKVLVMLLLGKPARMSVHRPEHCYRAAGYAMLTEQIGVQLRPQGEDADSSFSTALFSREETSGPNQLRIFWSFSDGSPWKCPKSPRLEYARSPLLYKLYVLRNVNSAQDAIADDPCIRLMGKLLPLLRRTLGDD